MNATCFGTGTSAWLRNTLATLMLIFAGAILAVQAGQASAAAPANSVIGNQASATYSDGVTTRSTSSNTVQTTVAQVKSFTLLQTGAKTVPANQQVCYPHSIVNTGNGADTYALNAPATGVGFAHTALAYFADSNQDGLPDNGVAITTTGALNASPAAGSTFNFVVCGTTAASATPTQTGTITVSATDTNTPTANTLTATDTTTIGTAAISVTKKLSSVAPPGYTPVSGGASPNVGPLYIILDYTNSGSVAATSLLMTDALPAGMLYVPGSGRWTASGATALSDTNTSNPAGISYTAPTTLSNGTISATIASIPAGTSGTVYFQVQIASNVAVGTITNTVQYGYSYIYFNPSMMANQTITVPPAASNNVQYAVAQVAAVAANGSATTTGLTDAEPVTVASAAPGQTITFTNYVWNNGNAADGFDISILNTPLNGSGCNPASVTANACTFPTGTTFQIQATGGATALLNSGGAAASPDTGTIPIVANGGTCPAPYITSTSSPTRCGYAVVITATLPAGAAPGNNGGNNYRVVVQAQSFTLTATDTVPNVLTTIAANIVDLTNNAAAPTTVANGSGVDDTAVKVTNTVTPSASATTTTRFTLFVNNLGATSAIYNLNYQWLSVPAGVGLSVSPAGVTGPSQAAATASGNTLAGWTVTFRDSANGTDCTATTGGAISSTGGTPVPAATGKIICAEVIVPAATSGSSPGTPTYAAPGNYAIQFGTSQQGNPSVFDTIRDQVTVQSLHNVTLTPNGAQNTVPGGVVTYAHTLTNNGNVPETITFPAAMAQTNSQTPTYTWSSSAYLDNNNNNVIDGTDTLLSSGGPVTSVTLQPNETRTILVSVSAPLAAGSPPNLTQTTITYNAGANTATATDTTTLTAGLKLDKYQQLTSCTATPTVTFSAGVPTAPWTNTAIPAGVNTRPGSCIAYLVVGTNTTGSNITAIVMSDAVPANTALETGCGAPTATGPLAITGTYTSGFTGSVAAQSSPLASTPLLPSGTATMQFCVKIN